MAIGNKVDRSDVGLFLMVILFKPTEGAKVGI